MSNVIEIKDLSFKYEVDFILEHLSLTLEECEFVALVGSNGAGKSTLMNLILSYLKPNSGSIALFNDPIEKNNHYKDIAYISQNVISGYKDFPSTVQEVIKVNLRYLKRKDNSEAYLELVGLQNHKKASLKELSGGQLQRLAIVLALIKEAKLLILDEPTSGIDHSFSVELYKLLQTLSKNGKTILMVTHNLQDALPYVDRVLRIQNKQCSSIEKETMIVEDMKYANLINL